MSYLDILQAQLIHDEGKKNVLYLDSKNIETIGIGHNLHKPISDRAIQVIFEDDMKDAEDDAKRLIQSFEQLSDARKAVVVNMAFNLGYNTFSQFRQTLDAIHDGDYNAAADCMLHSTWASQVGDRAKRLANAMRTG